MLQNGRCLFRLTEFGEEVPHDVAVGNWLRVQQHAILWWALLPLKLRKSWSVFFRALIDIRSHSRSTRSKGAFLRLVTSSINIAASVKTMSMKGMEPRACSPTERMLPCCRCFPGAQLQQSQDCNKKGFCKEKVDLNQQNYS